MSRLSVVLCTVPVAEAEPLVDRLLDARLIACANLIGPMRSRYRWEGVIETSAEMLLVLKTPLSCVPELTTRISQWHSYDVPEVLAFTADSGLETYLTWARGECPPPSESVDPAD